MKVKANVYVTRNGYPLFLRAGDEIPDGVTVTNPAVIDDSPAESPKAEEKSEPDAVILPAPAPAPKRRAPAKKAQPASE